MLRLLVDTCVWLDLAKDYRNQPVIAALEDIVHQVGVELIVPEIVLEEFERNKERVATEAKRSLQSHFGIVREAIWRFGHAREKDAAIKALDEVDHAAIYRGEAVNESIEKVEELLRSVAPIPVTDIIKTKAADRALLRAAPFHRSKNSIGDAIIIETYADEVRREERGEAAFAFVTHNKADFSREGGDNRQPHVDLEPLFDGTRSKYWVSLTDLLNDLDVDLLANYDLQFYGAMQARGLSEIMEAQHLIYRQVWYNRHRNLRINIERGREKVVTDEEWKEAKPRGRQRMTTEGTWHLAQEAARKTRDEVGVENLGPWTDFEWGMLNGKLSALRWVMGDEWDMLDT